MTAEGKAKPVYDKILVAVDQSPVAKRVLTAARELAQPPGGEVRVLDLREREHTGGRGGVVDYETGEEARATADRTVARAGA
jgi:nucleotide-binding universal stress UspA family protein